MPAATTAASLAVVIPLEDAQRFVLEQCRRLPAAASAGESAIGRVLARDVVATEAVPPFRNSAVDGYAVRSVDTATPPTELDVVDEVAAGQASLRTVGPGQAIRIMTGAPIPAGADAVVMVERTTTNVDRTVVGVGASVADGDGIRDAGSDVDIGELVFAAGTEVTPAVAGVLASINAGDAPTYRRPHVAVLSTGDELITDGSPLGPGQIRESNLTMLSALLRGSGADVTNLGVVPDDEGQLEQVLREAASKCDAIVTSGGVSMGDYDVVKAVLGRIAQMRWMQVAIKPAKPFAFGVLDGVPIFGLPGNPVSSMVSFEMFARPGLRQMAGHSQLERPSVIAIADRALERHPDGRVHLDRVHAAFGEDGRLHVVPARAQGSHQLAATALANAIAVVPDGGSVPAGAEVRVLLL